METRIENKGKSKRGRGYFQKKFYKKLVKKEWERKLDNRKGKKQETQKKIYQPKKCENQEGKKIKRMDFWRDTDSKERERERERKKGKEGKEGGRGKKNKKRGKTCKGVV